MKLSPTYSGGGGGGARKTLIVNWSKFFYASRSFKHNEMISIHFANVKFTVIKWIKYARLVKYTTWFRLQTVKTVEQIITFLQTCFFFLRRWDNFFVNRRYREEENKVCLILVWLFLILHTFLYHFSLNIVKYIKQVL